MKVSVSDFVASAARYGHEDSDYSSLASALVIDAAVTACACPDSSQLVFNVASVCEKADKPSLKRFYNALRKCRAGASDVVGILKVLAQVPAHEHDAYGAV